MKLDQGLGRLFINDSLEICSKRAVECTKGRLGGVNPLHWEDFVLLFE